jgi:hypothetical protein
MPVMLISFVNRLMARLVNKAYTARGPSWEPDTTGDHKSFLAHKSCQVDRYLRIFL